MHAQAMNVNCARQDLFNPPYPLNRSSWLLILLLILPLILPVDLALIFAR
jgi:hypothetical protein